MVGARLHEQWKNEALLVLIGRERNVRLVESTPLPPLCSGGVKQMQTVNSMGIKNGTRGSAGGGGSNEP